MTEAINANRSHATTHTELLGNIVCIDTFISSSRLERTPTPFFEMAATKQVMLKDLKLRASLEPPSAFEAAFHPWSPV